MYCFIVYSNYSRAVLSWCSAQGSCNFNVDQSCSCSAGYSSDSCAVPVTSNPWISSTHFSLSFCLIVVFFFFSYRVALNSSAQVEVLHLAMATANVSPTDCPPRVFVIADMLGPIALSRLALARFYYLCLSFSQLCGLRMIAIWCEMLHFQVLNGTSYCFAGDSCDLRCVRLLITQTSRYCTGTHSSSCTK
jgi:hypothetical protein